MGHFDPRLRHFLLTSNAHLGCISMKKHKQERALLVEMETSFILKCWGKEIQIEEEGGA